MESIYAFCVSARLPHPPIILEAPKNQTIYVGDNVTFVCHILSDLQPHVQWLKHYLINGSYTDSNGTAYVNVIRVRSLPDFDVAFDDPISVSLVQFCGAPANLHVSCLATRKVQGLIPSGSFLSRGADPIYRPVANTRSFAARCSEGDPRMYAGGAELMHLHVYIALINAGLIVTCRVCSEH